MGPWFAFCVYDTINLVYWYAAQRLSEALYGLKMVIAITIEDRCV